MFAFQSGENTSIEPTKFEETFNMLTLSSNATDRYYPTDIRYQGECPDLKLPEERALVDQALGDSLSYDATDVPDRVGCALIQTALHEASDNICEKTNDNDSNLPDSFMAVSDS